MASWDYDDVVITDIGLEALAKVQAGIGALTVTRVMSGAGRVDSSLLHSQTAVLQEKQEFDITDVVTDIQGSNLKLSVNNSSLTSAYTLNQIGVYCTHPDYANEFLYVIAQCVQGTGDFVPLPASTPVVLSFNLYVKHSNTDNFVVNLDMSGYLDVQDIGTIVAPLSHEDLKVPYEYLRGSGTAIVTSYSAGTAEVKTTVINQGKEKIENGDIIILELTEINKQERFSVKVGNITAPVLNITGGTVVSDRALNLQGLYGTIVLMYHVVTEGLMFEYFTILSPDMNSVHEANYLAAIEVSDWHYSSGVYVAEVEDWFGVNNIKKQMWSDNVVCSLGSYTALDPTEEQYEEYSKIYGVQINFSTGYMKFTAWEKPSRELLIDVKATRFGVPFLT